MALAIVQHKSAIRTNEIPGAITLASAPGNGNLIVVFMFCNIGHSSITVHTGAGNWIDAKDAIPGGTTQTGMMLYRYAGASESATLPTLWTAGSTYWAYDVYEISGVSGTFATDCPLIDQQSSTGSLSSLHAASQTSTVANAIAICAGGQYDGSHNPTVNESYVADETQNNNANYGSTAASHLAMAATGATDPTMSFGGSIAPLAMFTAIFQPVGSTTETGTGVMAFSGIAMNGAGADSHGGTGGMAFAGIKMNGAGADTHVAPRVNVIVVG